MMEQWTVRLALAAAVGHIRVLPFGVRDRFARLLARPEVCPRKAFTVDFFGQRYSGHLDNFIDWSVYMFGAFEADVAQLVLRIARSGFEAAPVVWDVGANCGHHTLLVAPHARTVHAFEPMGALCDCISMKVRENDLRNVVVHQLGLGDKDGVLPFLPPRDRNAGTGAFYQPGLRDGEMGGRSPADLPMLPTTRGDALVASGVVPPDLLKMDIEGFEYQALAGMHDTLRASRPVIVLEYGPLLEAQTHSLRRSAELFGERYDWYQIREALGSLKLRPFHGAPRDLEGKGFLFNILGVPEERSARVFAALSDG
jgi:FkbM family methyltransferase